MREERKEEDGFEKMKEEEIILLKRIRAYLQDVWEHEEVVPYDWQVENYILEYFINLTQKVLSYLLNTGLIVKIQEPFKDQLPRLCLTSYFSEAAEKLKLFSEDDE